MPTHRCTRYLAALAVGALATAGCAGQGRGRQPAAHRAETAPSTPSIPPTTNPAGLGVQEEAEPAPEAAPDTTPEPTTAPTTPTTEPPTVDTVPPAPDVPPITYPTLPQRAVTAPPVQSGGVLECIRSYEQGADGYATDTGNGYYGAYQFDLQTWRSVGGSGNPADASPAEQDRRAQALLDSRGLAPWPTPSRNCG